MSHPYNRLPPRSWTPVDLIPLEVAVLCVNCGNISPSRNGRCSGCQSAATLKLSEVLERKSMLPGDMGESIAQHVRL